MELPTSDANQLMRLERLYGIGPARYGELDQLGNAVISEHQFMRKPINVSIQWTPEKLAHQPSSGVYSTVAKFPEDTDWPAIAWSVVMEFHTSKNHPLGDSLEATARFLVPEAPWDRLKKGCVFELYEGFKKTATVIVL